MSAPTASSFQRPEGWRRGVWLTHVGSGVFASKVNLEQAMAVLHEMGVNTLYPVVWNKGLTTFPSRTLEAFAGVTIAPEFGARDVLAEILEINARRQFGFDVIPWFEYGLKVFFGRDQWNPEILRQRELPLSSLPPESRFAIAAHRAGLLLADREQKWWWYDAISKAYFGFLDPTKPEVATFLQSFAAEIVERYAVQGFQIDDHFSMHSSFGWNPSFQEQYRAYLETKGLQRYDYARGDGLSVAEADTRDRVFTGYRTGLVDELGQTLARFIKSRKRELVTQISPAGDIGFSYKIWLQNWAGMVHAGAFDEFVFQAYRDNMADFRKLIGVTSISIARNRARGSLALFAGYQGRPRPTALLVEQIAEAKSKGLGVNFFFYDTLVLAGSTDSPEAQIRMAQIKQALAAP